MKKMIFTVVFLLTVIPSFAWGFYGHRKINYHAVFLLPPAMLVLFKPHLDFLAEHATDPDKRRYVVTQEAPRHYIDLDHYGSYPFPALPHKWADAVSRYSQDSLNIHGILPWWIQVMLLRLSEAFRQKNQSRILKYAADIGHYIADAHVPLHTSSNHNGQKTGQRGIHGFWESRIPEALAEKEWDFFIGKARYIKNPAQFIWDRLLESAAAADSALQIEKQLSARFQTDQKYSYELRNGQVMRQYSTAYAIAYDRELNGMIERRMRQSIDAVACFWYTAWVDAGQPNLKELQNKDFTAEELKEFGELNGNWKEHE